jgi:hypothetical protein
MYQINFPRTKKNYIVNVTTWLTQQYKNKMSNTNNMGDLQPKSNTTKIVLIVGFVGVVLGGIALLIFYLTRTPQTDVKVPINDTVPTLTDELNRWDASEQIFTKPELVVTKLPDSIMSGVDDSKLLVTVLKYLRDNGYKWVGYPGSNGLRENKIVFATSDSTPSLIPATNTGFVMYKLK